MSNYNEETGDLTFTKTGYQQAMSAFRKAFNIYIDKLFAISLDIHKQINEMQGRNSISSKKEKANELLSRYSSNMHTRSSSFAISFDLQYLIREELFRGKNGALTKPRRSAFPKLINTTREFTVNDGDLSITFKDAYEQNVGYTIKGNKQIPSISKQPAKILWRVDNNNRAVESAHASPLGKILLHDVLGNYTWRRGEGGVFYYIDEYMRDADHDNGMGSSSSVSEVFGPAGKQHQEYEAKQFEAIFRRSRSKRLR